MAVDLAKSLILLTQTLQVLLGPLGQQISGLYLCLLVEGLCRLGWGREEAFGRTLLSFALNGDVAGFEFVDFVCGCFAEGTDIVGIFWFGR